MSFKSVFLFAALVSGGMAQAQDCFDSSIVSPTPFIGNNGELFKLTDGSAWEVKYDYEYMYEYYPDVVVCPGRGKMRIKGRTLNVANVSSPGKSANRQSSKQTAGSGDWTLFEETNLQGSISGSIQQGAIFKTTSGNIYEVTGLTLQLMLELQPDVMVLRKGTTYKLVVKGLASR